MRLSRHARNHPARRQPAELRPPGHASPKSPRRSARASPGLRSRARSTAGSWTRRTSSTATRRLRIITSKDPEGLEILRHSTAHLLAQAVQSIYPKAQVTIGPVIEDGFYYDFAFERPFTPEDLEKFEQKMREIVKADQPVRRRVLSRDEAVAHFKSIGEHYKAEIIAAIPAGEEISLYGQGDWFDLCRGPHVPSTGKLGAFKLTKVAGAYWRGDSRNEMLQRIYGTAWPDEKQLKDYLTRLEEAEKRDHRRIGKELDLFHFQEEAPGAVFWHPNGWTIFQPLIGYMREKQNAAGYQEISAPRSWTASSGCSPGTSRSSARTCS